MKHKLITLLLAIVASIGTIFAQDIIITQDAERIDCTITEVSETEVKYKRADNPSGPVFTLSTSKISSIIYKNGTVQTFKQKEEQPQINAAAAGYDVWGNPDYSLYFGDELDVDKIPFVPGILMSYEQGKYIYGNVVMDYNTYKAFIQRHCTTAYKEFIAAQKMAISGVVLFGVGLGTATCAGLLLLGFPRSPVCYSLIGVGCGIGLGVGIPLVTVATIRQIRNVNTFNNSCADRQLSFQLNIHNDGLGLALNF